MPEPVKPFIFCVHAHQPIGNFDGVFEEAYEKSYKPFFDVLEKHPRVPAAVHVSGSLLDWLAEHKGDFIARLRGFAERGQVEFVGGAYYEPVYGMIPKHDLAGQIALMQRKIREFFGQDPQGAWLTERVWDPDLVAPLDRAGVKYTILDDLHLERARVRPPVTGTYEARDGERSVHLYATMKDLRYLIPFRKPQETVEYLRSAKTGPADVYVFGDDIEKFGMWPGTYAWVFEQGWLDQFFTLLSAEPSIRFHTFASYRATRPPLKRRVNVRHASYAEMMEWSGGRFYNFFEKYPESRYMRDRMQELSTRVRRAGDGEAARRARTHLYRSQCNCPYWHGVFGGLYLHHLRSAVFENLIRSEAALEGAPAKAGRVETRRLESGVRVRLSQPELASYFNPAYGGALEELDFLPLAANLTCNLQRHREPYHDAVLKKLAAAHGDNQPLSIHALLGSKEDHLEELIHYDPYRRVSFLDHCLTEPVRLEDFRRSSYRDAGDFADGQWRSRAGRSSLSLSRDGSVKTGGRARPLSIRKDFAAEGASTLRADYTLSNPGPKPLAFTLGVEFNFSIGEEEARQGIERAAVGEWVLRDSWRNVRIRLASSSPADLVACGVETVSGSESGLERTYQQLGVLLQRPVELAAGAQTRFTLRLTVER